MKLPRLDDATRRLYESSLPRDTRIATKSMFGGLGSFVNGNMFAGALGTQIFLRLAEADRASILREPGSGPFEPVKGHAMAEYVVVPASWRRDPARLHEWLGRSLDWVAAMPPKKGRKTGRAKQR